MTKTERREYLQRQNKTRAAHNEDSSDRGKESAASTKKRAADGNVKPASDSKRPKERKKRKRDDGANESLDDEDDEEVADVREDNPPSPRRTRGTNGGATASTSQSASSKSTEERILQTLVDKHAIPATFASVRGGENKGRKEDLCCVCFYGYAYGDAQAAEDERDEIMQCTSCDMNIHESCYGIPASKIPGDDFICELCQSNQQGQVRCALCRQVTTEAKKGAFKPVQEESRLRRDRGAWAHIACALWVPGCGFAAVGDDVRAEVTGIDYLSDELYNKSTTCALCNNREGVKMKCFNTHCEIHFHPLCGLRHEWIEDFFYYQNGDYVTHQDYEYVDSIKIHKPYCKWHDPNDRHGLRSSREKQQRKTQEEKEEEARQEEEMLRRVKARKQQRLEQSTTEKLLRRQDQSMAIADDEKEEGERAERNRRKREVDSMAEKSRIALQKARDQQRPQHSLTVDDSQIKTELSPSAARSTSPSPDSSAAGRDKARALLMEQVGKKRAAEIEEELYRTHPAAIDPTLPASQPPLVLSAAYKQKLQSVLANLRHNEQLCEDVLERKTTAAQLIAMDEWRMADERLRLEREKAKAEDTEERIRRNEVRTVRRMDGAIMQVREDTLEEVKGGDEQDGDKSALMADGVDVEVEQKDESDVRSGGSLTGGCSDSANSKLSNGDGADNDPTETNK